MKRFPVIIVFSILLVPAIGQDRREADSLLRVLNKTKPGIVHGDILLRLAQFHIFKPGENKVDFDSASSYINEADLLNKSLKSPDLSGYRLLTESFMVREKGQEEAAKQLVEKAIIILKSGNNRYYLGKAYYELSNYYGYREDDARRQKIELVKQSIAAFEQTPNIEEKAFSMKMLGDLYGLSREYDKTIEVLNRALAAYDSINYKNLQGVYDLLARAYKQNDDYKRALQYELLALKSAKAVNDSSMNLCLINNTLGVIYREIGRNEIAIKYYRDALEIARRHDDRFGIALLVYNISACLKDLDQSQEILDFLTTIPKNLRNPSNTFERSQFAMSYLVAYSGTGQYQQAQQYSNTLLGLVDSPEIEDEIRCMIYHNVANFYLKIGDFEKARLLLTKNISLFPRLAGNRRVAIDSRLWYKLDSAQENYRSAFSHLLTYKTISDSLFNETKSRQFQQLEVEYETAKKADSLKLKDQHISLLIQKNDLQKAYLKQADLVKNITIGGIVLAIIIVLLIYRQYRHKQQGSRIISLKNEQLQRLVDEKEWLLKEVHHRVKNNLQTVVSLLELQSEVLSSDALAAVQASQNRIYATSLLHQKLYQDNNVSSVNMESYLPELIHYLKEAFNVRNDIYFKLNIEPIEVDVSQAIPLGLIVNEVITNSIKYAFRGTTKKAEINITFTLRENDIAQLLITDNGSGFSADIEGQSTGLGLKLVRGLAEDIDGYAQIESEKGVRISIQFRIRSPFPEIKSRNESLSTTLV